MSDSTNTASFDADTYVLGSKTIAYAMQTLGVGIAMAVAWSFSSLVVAVIMFIITAFVMSLFMLVMQGILQFKLGIAPVQSLGTFVGRSAARVSSLFARKVAAA